MSANDSIKGCRKLKIESFKIAFIIVHNRNNAVVLFGTLKVQLRILTEVSDCDLLIVVCTPIQSTCILRFSDLDLDSSGSPGVRPTPHLGSHQVPK